MRLVTVGTGTVVPDPDRASACHWVEHGDTRVVVDCGAGSLQGLARSVLPWDAVDHLVISHFHADHIGEIPSLIFALRHAVEVPRTAALDIWGPPGTRNLFDAWAKALGTWLVEPGFDVVIHELQPGTGAAIGSLQVMAAETPHTPESLAFRIAADDSVLGYTGDTGPSVALAEFFRGADLLLSECSLPEDLVGENHLSPVSLAEMATGAGVERLLITHVYPQLRRQDVHALIAGAGFNGEIIVAHDGLELEV